LAQRVEASSPCELLLGLIEELRCRSEIGLLVLRLGLLQKAPCHCQVVQGRLLHPKTLRLLDSPTHLLDALLEAPDLAAAQQEAEQYEDKEGVPSSATCVFSFRLEPFHLIPFTQKTLRC